MAWGRSAWLGLALVVGLFCAPLFLGLGAFDQRNDEAIYSYAVDRILETGDWLTPRSIPTDGPFLEKPPLKFWLVAGAMRLGLLPVDDRGMRLLDALFCSAAFVYVYLLGQRMAGPVAGAISVFLLFSYDPLLFEHGVRGNNMEGMLMLAYAGGVYHFSRWATDDRADVRRRHALGTAVLFVAAFMSKFVAAAFLPIIGVSSLALRRRDWPVWRARWREWLLPAGLAALLIAPWFAYQSVRGGGQFWYEIVGVHVYARFFETLVPSHLAPWHHYFTKTWSEFGTSGRQVITALGAAALIWPAWRHRDWLAQLSLTWWIVPFALMSLGTSKLFYYAYPFLPPLALGGGLVAAACVRALRGPGLDRLAARLGVSLPEADATGPLTRRRRVLLGGGALCVALAIATALFGSLTVEIDGVRLFRNSSAPRAVFLGAVLWYLGGFRRRALMTAGVAGLALLLPVSGYAHRVQRFSTIDHPLRTIRDCALAVQATGASPGVLAASGDLHHAYFYYLRRLGPWMAGDSAPEGELARRLEDPHAQTPVILSMADYVALGGRAPAGGPATPMLFSPVAAGAHLTRPLPRGVSIGDVVVILLPGSYEPCAVPAARAGSNELPSEVASSDSAGAVTSATD
jgi:4-amino-4-deoxy-L-arabinose transferase-like glycosyltransferase